MNALPGEVFLADDSLGWVYQYWQADRKEAINHSEEKIGAAELPAVTQLFTEDYMVLFLLHNTLGAWWAGKVLAAKPALVATAGSEDELRAACAVGGVEWAYLRFVRDDDQLWHPAAGTFEGWPKTAKDVTLLDPCMGSGHFLVFALPMLAALRAKEEGIPTETATSAVLRDNLFGLEIDPRCTQIAAFNLALTAWRRVGYRQLPVLHIACSGLSLGVTKAEWLKLAERVAAAAPGSVSPKSDLLGTEHNLFSDAMNRGFERLYDLFARGPWLGSLIDPHGVGGDLVEPGFIDLEPILTKLLAKADSADMSEMAVAAQGLAKAAEILARRFALVITNVPYLGRSKQDDVLATYCEESHPDAKAELATCFVERCLEFCSKGGSAALVTPQNWLFLRSYKRFRKALLISDTWNLVTRLGPAAFREMNWWAANTTLLVISRELPAAGNTFVGFDVSANRDPDVKAVLLKDCALALALQARQLARTDSIVAITAREEAQTLADYVTISKGICTGDRDRFVRQFWEVIKASDDWSWFRTSVSECKVAGGCEDILFWQGGFGDFVEFVKERLGGSTGAWIRGDEAWGRRGIAIGRMRNLPCTLYAGELFDDNSAVVVPKDESQLPILWDFINSPDCREALRELNQKVSVDNTYFAAIPFDIESWDGKSALAGRELRMESSDPTQWLFNGQPKDSYFPLQVAVARLVGYQWPRQTGSSFPDCPALGHDGLEKHAAHDGVVTLSPVKGEAAGADRLIALLTDAFGTEWSAGKLDSLLTQVEFAGKSLDDWLRDGFFQSHCEVFHQRPFVWHIWDGRRDGFNALVNYHRLAAPNGEGRRTLEKLLFTFLGDWIDRQRSDQKAGVDGADARVAAAEKLKEELTNILAGEPPYDVFVRWKPLVAQPVGWEPDLNDGVQMNIRPFMSAKPLGARKKGACILRSTPRIKWDKDRGKELQRPRGQFPWFWGWDEQTADFAGTKAFDGNRWNDLHYSRSFKEAARARSEQ